MISVTGKKAFSLIELLVAIAILSVGIITIIQAISFSGRAAGLSSDLIEATFLAQDKIQEWGFKEKHGLINKETPIGEGKIDKFNWEYALTPEPDLSLYNLKFNVTWQRSNRQEKITFNTYLR